MNQSSLTYVELIGVGTPIQLQGRDLTFYNQGEQVDTQMDELTAQVQRLRRMNVLTIVIAVAVCATTWMENRANAEPKPVPKDDVFKQKQIQASNFQLVDDKGQVRAALRFHDQYGTPFLAFYDTQGNTRGGFALNADGCPLVSMSDGKQKQRLRMYVDNDGLGAFQMLDEEGRSIVECSGDGRIQLNHAASKASIDLRVAENDSLVSLTDTASGAGIELSASKRVGSLLKLIDKSGTKEIRTERTK